jgi:hypothetical protein
MTETGDNSIIEQKPHQRVGALLLERTIARHSSSGGYVDVRSVLNDRSLPAVITRFLDLELRFSIAKGVAPLRKHFRIDQRLEAPAVETFTTGLMLTSTMPASEFSDAFTSAMEVAHAYLVRPEQTLAALLTNNEAETKLDKRFFDILEHAAEYQYLSEITLAWAERLRAGGVTHTDEVTLYRQFRKIHQGVLGNFPASEITRLLTPLYDLYSLAEIRSIERGVLEDFFSDRGMSRARNAIESGGAESLTLLELQVVLDGLFAGGEIPDREVTPVEEAPSQIAEEPTDASASYDEFIRDLKNAGIPVVTPKKGGQAASGIGNIPAFTINREALIRETPIELPGVASQTTAIKEVLALPVQMEEAQLRSLEQLIDSESRKKFIRKLFEDNEIDYMRYLALLNQSENWKQASVYVDAIFLRHRVNPYSKTAIRFADLIYSRFVQSAI